MLLQFVILKKKKSWKLLLEASLNICFLKPNIFRGFCLKNSEHFCVINRGRGLNIEVVLKSKDRFFSFTPLLIYLKWRSFFTVSNIYSSNIIVLCFLPRQEVFWNQLCSTDLVHVFSCVISLVKSGHEFSRTIYLRFSGEEKLYFAFGFFEFILNLTQAYIREQWMKTGDVDSGYLNMLLHLSWHWK